MVNGIRIENTSAKLDKFIQSGGLSCSGGAGDSNDGHALPSLRKALFDVGTAHRIDRETVYRGTKQTAENISEKQTK